MADLRLMGALPKGEAVFQLFLPTHTGWLTQVPDLAQWEAPNPTSLS